MAASSSDAAKAKRSPDVPQAAVAFFKHLPAAALGGVLHATIRTCSLDVFGKISEHGRSRSKTMGQADLLKLQTSVVDKIPSTENAALVAKWGLSASMSIGVRLIEYSKDQHDGIKSKCRKWLADLVTDEDTFNRAVTSGMIRARNNALRKQQVLNAATGGSPTAPKKGKKTSRGKRVRSPSPSSSSSSSSSDMESESESESGSESDQDEDELLADLFQNDGGGYCFKSQKGHGLGIELLTVGTVCRMALADTLASKTLKEWSEDDVAAARSFLATEDEVEVPIRELRKRVKRAAAEAAAKVVDWDARCTPSLLFRSGKSFDWAKEVLGNGQLALDKTLKLSTKVPPMMWHHSRYRFASNDDFDKKRTLLQNRLNLSEDDATQEIASQYCLSAETARALIAEENRRGKSRASHSPPPPPPPPFASAAPKRKRTADMPGMPLID
jgi:hypothetical protein